VLILGVDTGSGSQKKKEKSILAQSPNEKRWRDGQLSSVTQHIEGQQLQRQRHTKKSTMLMSTSLVALRMKFLQAHQSKPLADLAKSDSKHRSHKFSLPKGHEKALRRSCSARNAAQFATRKRPASTITFSPVRVARTSSAVPSLKD